MAGEPALGHSAPEITLALMAAAHFLAATAAGKHGLGHDLGGSNQYRNERDAVVGRTASSTTAESQLK